MGSPSESKTKNVLKKLKIKQKTRRGWVKSRKRRNKKESKNKEIKSFTLIGANATGLKSKTECLNTLIDIYNPACIMIQESKLKRKN